MDHAETLAIASSALGSPLADGVPLGGSRRSLVLRARRVDDGELVVVKRFTPEDAPAPGPNGYQRELVGLDLLSGTPDLLAHDDDADLLVMSDMGDHPTLADVLRGSDADAAWAASLLWARSLGELLAGSVDRVPEARRLLGGGGDREPTARRVTAGAHALADASGVALEATVLSELARVHALLASETALVLSPGDMCPDNVLLTPDRAVFVDLEATTVRPVFFDAAYALAPFVTCWCVYAEPDGFTDAMFGAVLDGVRTSAPGLLGDRWEQDVVIATVGWALWMAPMLLHYAVDPQKRMGPPGVPALTMRELMLLRLDWVAERAADNLPETAGFAARVATGLRDQWGELPLPVYPAWS